MLMVIMIIMIMIMIIIMILFARNTKHFCHLLKKILLNKVSAHHHHHHHQGAQATTTATATKTSLKGEVPLLQTLSRLFYLIQFVKSWNFFLALNSKRLYRSSGKEKESRCLVFTPSTKREIRTFHVVVVQWQRRNVQKSVMHVQNCCFANLNLLLLCRFRWGRCRCCSSSLPF